MQDETMNEAETETAAEQTPDAAPPQEQVDEPSEASGTPAPEGVPEHTSPAETPVGSAGAKDLAEPGVDPNVWSMILKARNEERVAERDVAELAEDLKAAKKKLETASSRLGELIDDAKFPTLFSGPKAEDSTQTEREIMPDPIQDAGAAPDDAWRAVVIAEMEPKLKPGKLKALAEHAPPILTMGDMADWQWRREDFWTKDIRGFGSGGAEQYAAAADAYWAAHPQAADEEPMKVMLTAVNGIPIDPVDITANGGQDARDAATSAA